MKTLSLSRRYKAFINYVLDRIGEPSTWQGLGFLIGLFGSKVFIDLDWGGAAALGGTFSAFLKSVFPDKL